MSRLLAAVAPATLVGFEGGSMLGIVYDGETTEVTPDLEVRDPGPHEVRVQTVAAGICHSDLSVINGTIPYPVPVVLGHEGAGVVAQVGSAVERLQVGDHVVLMATDSCGACPYCASGRPTWCRAAMGKRGQPFTLRGTPLWNFAALSVFAEETVVGERQAVRIDPAIPLTAAALVGCGVITGVGSVLNRADVSPETTAAVFGVGGIGLNVIQALRVARARRIIAIDTLATKEPLARQFGATDFIRAGSVDVTEAVRELLPGTSFMAPGGVDWSFECVGDARVLADAMAVLDCGGTCLSIGIPPPGAELTLPIGLLNGDRSLVGVRYGLARPHHDVPMILDLYQRGLLDLDGLVSATYRPSDFHTAVGDMEAGRLARGVLLMA
jgi:S-(hydroxymethyl)glutathione dehydrogenase/alcohol dehydrogenase